MTDFNNDLELWDDAEITPLIDQYLNEDGTLAAEGVKRVTLIDEGYDHEYDCLGSCGAGMGGQHTVACNDNYEALYPSEEGKTAPGIEEKVSSSKTDVDMWDDIGGGFKWTKHSHLQTPITLSDGTVILCSTHHKRDIADEPDLACYLDGIWKPATVAFHLGWTDYGLPLVGMADVRIIADELLASARAGRKVEIGCIGGHGRTGTFLAILDLMTMENPDAELAMNRVWTNYCKDAIETKEQEWYISAWAADLSGQPIPPLPPKPVYTTYKKADTATPALTTGTLAQDTKDTVTLNGKTVSKPSKAKGKHKAKGNNRKAGTSRFKNNSRKGK